MQLSLYKLYFKLNKEIIKSVITCTFFISILLNLIGNNARNIWYVVLAIYLLSIILHVFYRGYYCIRHIRIVDGKKVYVVDHMMPRNISLSVRELRIEGVKGVYSRVPLKKGSLDLLVYKYCEQVLNLKDKGEITKALVLGCGGGAVPKFLVNKYFNISVHIVEVYKEIIEIAKEFFLEQELKNIKTYEVDALEFVSKLSSENKYDFIFNDIFIGSNLNEDSYQVDFLKKLKGALSDDGILVSNIGNIQNRDIDINMIVAQYRMCFDNVCLYFENNSLAIIVSGKKAKNDYMCHCEGIKWNNFIKL